MPVDPLASELMEKLHASGRANVRMDVDGSIMWDDPTALTGVQYLRPDMFPDALTRLDHEEHTRSTAAYISLPVAAPPAMSPPSQRRIPRVLVALLLVLLAAGGIALVYGA